MFKKHPHLTLCACIVLAVYIAFSLLMGILLKDISEREELQGDDVIQRIVIIDKTSGEEYTVSNVPVQADHFYEMEIRGYEFQIGIYHDFAMAHPILGGFALIACLFGAIILAILLIAALVIVIIILVALAFSLARPSIQEYRNQNPANTERKEDEEDEEDEKNEA